MTFVWVVGFIGICAFLVVIVLGLIWFINSRKDPPYMVATKDSVHIDGAKITTYPTIIETSDYRIEITKKSVGNKRGATE